MINYKFTKDVLILALQSMELSTYKELISCCDNIILKVKVEHKRERLKDAMLFVRQFNPQAVYDIENMISHFNEQYIRLINLSSHEVTKLDKIIKALEKLEKNIDKYIIKVETLDALGIYVEGSSDLNIIKNSLIVDINNLKIRLYKESLKGA